MKYGEHLKANISPEYGKLAYLNYNELDDCIRELAADAPSRYVTYCDAVKTGCEWFWNFRCHIAVRHPKPLILLLVRFLRWDL
jgi:hypothetical protein